MSLIRRAEGQRAYRPFVQSGKAAAIPIRKARAVGIILATNGSGTHQTWGQLDAWAAAEGLTRVLEQIGWLYEANGTAWSTAEQNWWISQLASEAPGGGQANREFRYPAWDVAEPMVFRGHGHRAQAGDTTAPYRAAAHPPFQLPASFSLTVRRGKLPRGLPTTVTRPSGVAALAMGLVKRARLAGREWFLVFGTDVRLNVEAWWVGGIGTVQHVAVLPADVFGPAVALGSVSGVILVHNHPSGDPTPSSEDRALTSRLERGGEILGIKLVDHLVVARDGFSSFAELGLLDHTTP